MENTIITAIEAKGKNRIHSRELDEVLKEPITRRRANRIANNHDLMKEMIVALCDVNEDKDARRKILDILRQKIYRIGVATVLHVAERHTDIRKIISDRDNGWVSCIGTGWAGPMDLLPDLNKVGRDPNLNFFLRNR